MIRRVSLVIIPNPRHRQYIHVDLITEILRRSMISRWVVSVSVNFFKPQTQLFRHLLFGTSNIIYNYPPNRMLLLGLRQKSAWPDGQNGD